MMGFLQLAQFESNQKMYQARQTQNSRVGQRRNAFMKDIQNISRDNIKKRYRSQMVSFLGHEELSDLIGQTESRICGRELDLLIKYVNQHYPKAIGHLGNLILEGGLAISRIEKYQLQPGHHPYWMWLIQVLVQQQYCTLNLLDHCIKALSPLRAEETVKRALSILFKITSSSMHSPLLFRDEGTSIVIVNTCFRENSASELGYLLLHQLVKKDDWNISERLSSGILRQKVVKALLNGSLKVQRRIKSLTCKIIRELIQKDIYFEQLFETMIMLMKQTTELGMDHLMLDVVSSFVKKATVEHVMYCVHLGLIVELGVWKKQFEIDQEEDKVGRIVSLARELCEKVSGMEMISKGVYRELERFNLLPIEK